MENLTYETIEPGKTVVNDVTIIDKFVHKHQSEGYNHLFSRKMCTVKCNICGIVRNTSIAAMIRGDRPSKHGTDCYVAMPDSTFIGQTKGDMTVKDIIKTNKERRVLLHCNVCHKERTTSLGNWLLNKGLSHKLACNRTQINIEDYYPGKVMGDFSVLKAYHDAHRAYVDLECNVCGKIRKHLQISQFKHGKGLSHKFTCIPGTINSQEYIRFYRIYQGIIDRTTDPRTVGYAHYGKRGIDAVAWPTYQSFKDDMLESYLKKCEEIGEKNVSIDRIDVDGPYCKENCRWVGWKEQTFNYTCTNHFILHDPKGNTYVDKNLADFCRRHKLNQGDMHKVLIGKFRQRYGWTGRMISKEEYLQLTLPPQPDNYIELFTDILNDVYEDRRSTKPWLINNDGSIKVPICSLKNRAMCYVSEESIDAICTRDNSFNLKVRRDTESKYPALLISK